MKTQSFRTLPYSRPHYYTPEELATHWKNDQLNDARCAREQAANGPFYPHLGVTKESLLKYAEDCEAQAKQPIPAEFAHSKISAPAK